MKILNVKILAVTICAFLFLTAGTGIYAGNGGVTISSAQKDRTVTTQDITNYLASQGIKALSIVSAGDGTSNVIVTTSGGARITVYISGDQFLGHDDLPQ